MSGWIMAGRCLRRQSVNPLDEPRVLELEQARAMRGPPVPTKQQQGKMPVIIPVDELRAFISNQKVIRKNVIRKPGGRPLQNRSGQSPGERHILEVRHAIRVDPLVDEEVSAGVQIDQSV